MATAEHHQHSDTPAIAPISYFARSRGTTAAPTAVQAGDILGEIYAVGHDGTDYATSAKVEFSVGGTPGSNDMPGLISFYTSPDGSQTLASRMSIRPDGDVRVSSPGTDSTSVVTVNATQALTNKTLTTPVVDGATLNGDMQYDATPNTDDTFNGDSTNTFNAGATIAQWEAVYLNSSSQWVLTDADAASTAGGVMVALATAAGTSGNALRVLLWGFARNDAWNWTVGGPIYLGLTPGELTQTPPSATDDVQRIVGYATTADTIYWNPSNDWITRI